MLFDINILLDVLDGQNTVPTRDLIFGTAVTFNNGDLSVPATATWTDPSGDVVRTRTVDVLYNDKTAPLADKVQAAPKFYNFLLDKMCSLGETIAFSSIFVRDVKMFGPRIVGFIFAELDLKQTVKKTDGTFTTTALPATIFIRGDAVSVFFTVHVTDTNEIYFVVLEQFRIGAKGGQTSFVETCAGMVDLNTGEFGGVAANELKQEMGVIVKGGKVQFGKGAAAKTTQFPLVPVGVNVPSVGGCEEAIAMFKTALCMTRAEFDAWRAECQGKTFGMTNEGEMIVLVFVQAIDMFKRTCAVGNADILVAKGLLPKQYTDGKLRESFFRLTSLLGLIEEDNKLVNALCDVQHKFLEWIDEQSGGCRSITAWADKVLDEELKSMAQQIAGEANKRGMSAETMIANVTEANKRRRTNAIKDGKPLELSDNTDAMNSLAHYLEMEIAVMSS